MGKLVLKAVLAALAVSPMGAPALAAEPGPVHELSTLACPKIVQPVLSDSEFTGDLPLNIDVASVCECAGGIVSRDPHLNGLNAGPRDNLKAKLQDKRFAAYFFQRTLQASFSCSASELKAALDRIHPAGG